jgi:hypothetical protein
MSHPIRKCVECGEMRQRAGRGLCSTCYGRVWKATSPVVDKWRLTQLPSGKTGPRAPVPFRAHWPHEARAEALMPRLVDIQFLVDLIEQHRVETGLIGERRTGKPSYCPLCGHAGLRHAYFDDRSRSDRGWTCLAALENDDSFCSCKFGILKGVAYWDGPGTSVQIPETLLWKPWEASHEPR